MQPYIFRGKNNCWTQKAKGVRVMCGSAQSAPSLSHASSIRGEIGKMGTNWNCHYCDWMSRHNPRKRMESIDFYLIYAHLYICLACLSKMNAQASADLLYHYWVKLSTSEPSGFGPKSIRAKHLAAFPEFIYTRNPHFSLKLPRPSVYVFIRGRP